jgi:membrane-associated phospholipid phosphatase
MRRIQPNIFWAVCCALMLTATAGRADDFNHREARFVSGTGTNVYVAAGLLLPLIEDGKNGTQHSVRTADSLLTSTLLAEGLKKLVRESRPNDPNNKNSFPSGHATAAFTIATMESAFHPHQKLWWYLGATVIGASRVQKRAHHVHDVLAGAALGYGVSRWELSRPHGLLLFPFVKPREEQSRQASAGLAFSRSF